MMAPVQVCLRANCLCADVNAGLELRNAGWVVRRVTAFGERAGEDTAGEVPDCSSLLSCEGVATVMLDHEPAVSDRRPLWRAIGLRRMIIVLAATGLALLIVGVGLGLVLIGRHGGGPIQGWDETVWRWSIGHRGPLVGVDKVVAKVGDAALLGPLCVVIGAIMFALRRSPRALIPILAYLGGEGLVFLVRAVMHRGRPVTADYPAPGALRGVHETSYSFPSGHAVAVTAVLFALFGVLAIGRRWWWPWLPAFVLSAFVADSRLLLGVHWFSDVAIGLVLGIVWGIAVALVLVRVTWADLGLGRRPAGGDAAVRPDEPAPHRS